MCGLEKAVSALDGEAQLLGKQQRSLLTCDGHTRMGVGTELD